MKGDGCYIVFTGKGKAIPRTFAVRSLAKGSAAENRGCYFELTFTPKGKRLAVKKGK